MVFVRSGDVLYMTANVAHTLDNTTPSLPVDRKDWAMDSVASCSSGGGFKPLDPKEACYKQTLSSQR
jgi:hypothetical protein